MARRTAALAALGPLALSLAFAACTGASSPGPTSGVLGETSEPQASGAEQSTEASGQTGAEVKACEALQAWSDEMHKLADMDTTTSSVDDVKTQLLNIKTAWSGVKASLDEVQAADEDAVRAAGDQLETAIDDVSTAIPVSDMVNQVKTAAEPLRTSYKEMSDGLGCTLENPY
jgi:methyl-accepting chemotaxis protein